MYVMNGKFYLIFHSKQKITTNEVVIPREAGDTGLYITLVPKVDNHCIPIVGLVTFIKLLVSVSQCWNLSTNDFNH